MHVHVGVLGHGQPDAVGLLAGQQTRHAGAVDGCDHPILIFQDARSGRSRCAFGVHHVGLGPIEHDHAVDGAGQGSWGSRNASECGASGMAGAWSVTARALVAAVLWPLAAISLRVLECVGRAQRVGVQVCNHLHGMEKPSLLLTWLLEVGVVVQAQLGFSSSLAAL